jgi:hypothetical protein
MRLLRVARTRDPHLALLAAFAWLDDVIRTDACP